jgi:hypothetical protein
MHMLARALVQTAAKQRAEQDNPSVEVQLQRRSQHTGSELERLKHAANTLAGEIHADQSHQRNLHALRYGGMIDRGIGWSLEVIERVKEELQGTNRRYADASVSLPPATTWDDSQHALRLGMASIDTARTKLEAGDEAGARDDVERARQALERGRALLDHAHRRLAEYAARTISSGESTVGFLEGTRAAAETITLILGMVATGTWVAGVTTSGVSIAGATAFSAGAIEAGFEATDQLANGTWDPQQIIREAGAEAAQVSR